MSLDPTTSNNTTTPTQLLTLHEIFASTTERQYLSSVLDGEGEWGLFLVKVLILLVGLSTLSFSLDSVEELHEKYHDFFLGIDVFCLFFFTFEYFLRLSIAENRISYAFQLMSLIDLMSILPSWINILYDSAIPRLQFFRILRLFKFLVSTRKGHKAAIAFQQSWQDNSNLLLASSYLFICVWIVFSCLQYFAEFDNENMLHCVQPSVVTGTFLGECICDSNSCYGNDCECNGRYNSILSSMYFTLIEFSGTFQLAASHSTLGRFLAVGTAFASIGIFAVPTSLFAAALSKAATVIHHQNDSENDEVESCMRTQPLDTLEDIALQVAGSGGVYAATAVPAYTLSTVYITYTKILVALSVIFSVLSTFPQPWMSIVIVFKVVDVVCIVTFGMENVCRIAAEGPRHTTSNIFRTFLPAADIMAWLPSLIAYFSGWDTLPPPSIALTVALFRMLKLERYSNGFWILYQVMNRSWALLSVGGMATFCLLMFLSTLLFYTEKDNRDPNVRKYYTSVPKAFWTTTMNLSSGMVQVDYSITGRLIASALCLMSIAVFAVPIGAIGGGFHEVMSSLAKHDKRMQTTLPISSEEKKETTPIRRLVKVYGAVNLDDTKLGKKRDTSSPSNVIRHEEDITMSPEVSHNLSITVLFQSIRRYIVPAVQSNWFIGVSVLATLLGVCIEIIGTCKDLHQHHLWMEWEWSLEVFVIGWFTLEISCRTIACGREYITSKLGFLDLLATVPWYIAQGLLGRGIGKVVDKYDGPLRFFRLMRLMRLDAYSPSLSLIGAALDDCWEGLKVAVYSFVVLWFFFNEWLYISEHSSSSGADYCSTPYHYRTALSSLQYSAMLLTKGYGEMDNLSLSGQICCCTAVLAAIGISSVPASVLANSFVNILRGEAEKDHARKLKVALLTQRVFRRRRSMTNVLGVVRTATAAKHNSTFLSQLYKHLMGLDPTSWYPTISILLTTLNVVVVMLESVEQVYTCVDPIVWSMFELVCVYLFTIDYICVLVTIEYNLENKCSRWTYMTSLRGICALCSILPIWARLGFNLALGSDAVMYTPRMVVLLRIFRVFRIIGLDRYIKCFYYLNNVLSKVSSILTAAGIVALVVWVGGASLFYYAELGGRPDRGIVRFDSIPDSLYHCALFLVTDWQVQDFTPLGSVMCVVLSLFGVAIFAVPVGVLFEGFQNLITEQKDNPVINTSSRNLLKNS